MKVLLIAGGWSGEREVSLAGAKIIHAALLELGHEVTLLDLSDGFSRLLELAPQHDFAFLNLHGSPGEDGLVQALLDNAGTPYQGAGPAGSFLALNKSAAKAIFQREGILTPDWQLVTDMDQPVTLPCPLFVKPNLGGSSLGMSLVENPADLAPALRKVFDMGDQPLVEALKPGVELTCGVLGREPLPVIMIRPKPGSAFFDYANKYDADGAEEICPAPIDDGLTIRIQELALKAHEALGLRGYSRADFIFSDGEVYLLEVNTLPGMTATSLVPRAAKVAGYTFEGLIAELIKLGMG